MDELTNKRVSYQSKRIAAMEVIMYFREVNLQSILIYFIIALLLQACGGSDHIAQQPDGNPVTQNRSILSISNVHTLASLDSPVTLYNDDGNGIAIWSVSGLGRYPTYKSSGGSWFYYSLYDNASESWSKAQRLTESVEDADYGVFPKLVSNDKGFAALWRNPDGNLHASVFDGSEWTTTHGASNENTRIIHEQFTISTNSLDRYKIVSTNAGYALAWKEFSALYVSVFNGSEWTTTQFDDATVPTFEMTSNGRGYIITWYRPQTRELYASISQDGGTPGKAVLLDQLSSDKNYLEVISNGSGYLVLWEEADALLHGDIYDGSAWHAPEVLTNSSGSFAASNGKGYSVVWSKDSTILSRTYTTASGWSQSAEIFTHSNGNPANSNAAYITDFISNGSGYCALFTAYDNPEWGSYAAVNTLGDENWETATLLSQDANNFGRYITLASDGDSYAVAWSYYDGPITVSGDYSDEYTTHYYASVFQNATWHTTNEAINVVNGYTPYEITGHNGDYIITLKKTIDGVERLSSTLYDNNGGWKETETLEGDFSADSYPSITVNPTSGISVLWHQFNDSGTDISTFSNQWNGEQWLGQSLVSEANYLLGSSRYPQLINADNGQTLAVWTQYRSGHMALYANIRNNEDWSQPILLSDSLLPSKPPKIATNGTGFAVSWQEEQVDGLVLTKAIVFKGEEWDESLASRARVLAQGSLSTVTLTSNGKDYMLLYATYGEQNTHLVAHYFNGTDWLEPMIVAEDSYSPVTYPQITTNGETYLAAWFERSGDSYTDLDLVSSEFDGKAWSPDQRITSALDASKMIERWSHCPQLATNGVDYAVFWIDDNKIKNSFFTDSWSSIQEIGDISFSSGYGWGDLETLSVVSNGDGYAIAWHSSEIPSKSAVFANIYDGTSWSGARNLSMNDSPNVMFEMVNNSHLIKPSGKKYAILWGHRVEEFSDYSDAVYAKVFNGSEWSATTQLNTDASNNTQFQLASDGMGGYLAAWLMDNGSGKLEILTKNFNGSEWENHEFVDENDFSKHDLNLLGGANGYQAIWTQTQPEGDSLVRFPWAASGL